MKYGAYHVWLRDQKAHVPSVARGRLGHRVIPT